MSLGLLMCSTGVMAHNFEVDGIYYLVLSEENQNVAVTFKGQAYDSYNDEYTGKVVIPSTVEFNDNVYKVTAIYNEAFSMCSGMTELVVGDNVDIIGNKAFFNCTGLTSITIPESVTYIGSQAFVNCAGLTSVDFSDNITTIGIYAFSGCTGLTSLNIPKGISIINEYAFSSCTGLTELVIPDNIVTIAGCAFASCTGLKSVEISDNTTTICIMAFASCTELTTLRMGSKMSLLENYAFDNCTKLEDIYCTATTPPTIDTKSFMQEAYDNATLHVMSGYRDAYATANNWKSFVNITDDLAGVTDAVRDEVVINGVNGKLHIVGADANAQVSVYNLNGALLYQDTCSNVSSIALPQGMYLVQVGEVVKKVVL